MTVETPVMCPFHIQIATTLFPKQWPQTIEKCPLLVLVYILFLQPFWPVRIISLIVNTGLSGRKAYEPCYEKTNICLCKNKDADQLRGNREADQRLCFRYIDSTIPLLSKSEISSL